MLAELEYQAHSAFLEKADADFLVFLATQLEATKDPVMAQQLAGAILQRENNKACLEPSIGNFMTRGEVCDEANHTSTEVVETSNRFIHPHPNPMIDNNISGIDNNHGGRSMESKNPHVDSLSTESIASNHVSPDKNSSTDKKTVIESRPSPMPASHSHASSSTTENTKTTFRHPDVELMLASEAQDVDMAQFKPVPPPTKTCQGPRNEQTGVRMPCNALV